MKTNLTEQLKEAKDGLAAAESAGNLELMRTMAAKCDRLELAIGREASASFTFDQYPFVA